MLQDVLMEGLGIKVIYPGPESGQLGGDPRVPIRIIIFIHRTDIKFMKEKSQKTRDPGQVVFRTVCALYTGTPPAHHLIIDWFILSREAECSHHGTAYMGELPPTVQTSR